MYFMSSNDVEYELLSYAGTLRNILRPPYISESRGVFVSMGKGMKNKKCQLLRKR